MSESSGNTSDQYSSSGSDSESDSNVSDHSSKSHDSTSKITGFEKNVDDSNDNVVARDREDTVSSPKNVDSQYGNQQELQRNSSSGDGSESNEDDSESKSDKVDVAEASGSDSNEEYKSDEGESAYEKVDKGVVKDDDEDRGVENKNDIHGNNEDDRLAADIANEEKEIQIDDVTDEVHKDDNEQDETEVTSKNVEMEEIFGSDIEESDKEDDTDKKEVVLNELFGEVSDDEDERATEPVVTKEVTLETLEDEKFIRDDSTEARESDEDTKDSTSAHEYVEGQSDQPDAEHQVVLPAEEPENRIPVDIPQIDVDLGNEVHFVKLPNFLSVETRPFDPATYEEEAEDIDLMDEEGRTRLKLKVENTIRWRNAKNPETGEEVLDEEGKPIHETNARIVRWSDDSISLHLGDEIFDIHKNGILSDYNHLFLRQGNGLLGQAVFRTKLSFRPHSTESFTHRKMTMSMADRSNKTQKIRVIPISGMDPESHREEMIKKEEERLRAAARRENQRRRMRERQMHKASLTGSFLEDRESGDERDASTPGISIDSIKSKYSKNQQRKKSTGERRGSTGTAKRGRRGEGEIESGEESDTSVSLSSSSDEDESKEGRMKDATEVVQERDETTPQEEPENVESDDSDTGVMPPKRRRVTANKPALVDDDDDDDENESAKEDADEVDDNDEKVPSDDEKVEEQDEGSNGSSGANETEQVANESGSE